MTDLTQSLKRPARCPIWLPYLSLIELNGQRVKFLYKGGELDINVNEILSILVYGDYDSSIKLSDIENFSTRGIPVVIHRRMSSKTVFVHSDKWGDVKDTLSRQIRARYNQHKRRHIARKILLAKFKNMSWLVPAPKIDLRFLTIDEMRVVEAQHAREYWRRFFGGLGEKGGRRVEGPIKVTLDATSKFVVGPILRWIYYHNLSPFHGYLHTPTNYPSLAYDLIEPYRGIIEKTVYESFVELDDLTNSDDLTSIAINATKVLFHRSIYTGSTRQIITFQELLHGIVISLKSYLVGDQRQFIVPLPSKPTSGRPRKVAFRFYGRSAGRTDFWQKAREVSDSSQ